MITFHMVHNQDLILIDFDVLLVFVANRTLNWVVIYFYFIYVSFQSFMTDFSNSYSNSRYGG